MIHFKKQVSPTEREIWSFVMFDFQAVFVGWIKQEKPEGSKRKWGTVQLWNKYNRPNNNTAAEPELPESVKAGVVVEITRLIQVKTWKQYKGE